MNDPKCPKCAHEMENGFMVDQSHGGIAEARWAEGEATYSFWTGVQVRGHTQYRVRTYRCTTCGYLEAYAIDPPTPRPPMFGKK